MSILSTVFLALGGYYLVGAIAAFGTFLTFVGFIIYELHKSLLRILNFAVAPDVRRNGIGKQMVQRLIDKLSQQRRNEIVLEVRETNVPAQLFFASSGFRAVTVLRGHYNDTSEDAYYMRYCLHQDAADLYVPRNRIADVDAA